MTEAAWDELSNRFGVVSISVDLGLNSEPAPIVALEKRLILSAAFRPFLHFFARIPTLLLVSGAQMQALVFSGAFISGND